jgi:RNA polymerase sigma-70 factor (ECF subfamily)
LQEHAQESSVVSAGIEANVIGARAGNREALVNLCKAVVKDVMFRASFILNNHMDAEDVTQEVLIKVCKNIRDLKEPKAFISWLNTIIVNESRSQIARNAKYAPVLELQSYLDAEIEEDAELLPQDYVLREDDRRIVTDAIRTLTERQREAVMLHYYDGLTITETAGVMKTTRQNASLHLKLARVNVKREIEMQLSNAGYGKAYGIAAAPIGPLMTKALGQEAMLAAPAGNMNIEMAIRKSVAYISRASASAAGLGLFKSIVVIMVVACGIGIGVSVFAEKPEIPETDATGQIVYSGGDNVHSHVNPTGAAPMTDSTHGELTVTGWQITKLGGGDVIYGGTGADADWALDRMSKTGEPGDYELCYSLEDSVGYKYALRGSFIVDR